MTLVATSPVTDYSREMTIFTDGSALSNSKRSPAGWGVYVPLLKKSFSKGLFGTNNIAELTAIQFALWYVDKHYPDILKPVMDNLEHPDTIYIIADSEYAIKVVTGINNAKANTSIISSCKDLLLSIRSIHHVRILFLHVNSHTGGSDFMSTNNDIVDYLARTKAEEMKVNTVTPAEYKNMYGVDPQNPPTEDYQLFTFGAKKREH